MIDIDLKHLELDKQFLSNIVRNIDYNKQIIEFYEKYLAENGYSNTLINKIESIKNCNSFFELDYYKEQKVKDYKRTNLCKDKFCNNCKKVKQASRMARFLPEINKYKNYGIYHLVLTVPNVNSDNLEPTIKKMLKTFPSLIEFLKQKRKVKNIYLDVGYMGAIRSLEVTYNYDDYHPHLHVLLIANKLNINDKLYVNDYSYSRGKLVRKFADIEITIQKLWYMLFNDIRITKKNIDELKIGYSCTIDKFENDNYFELFKYMTKAKSDTVMTYDNFKTLYYALFNKRQIQGYGCLFRIKDEYLEEEINEIYDRIVNLLKEKEDPKLTFESPEQLLTDNDNILISRKKIHDYLRSLNND